MTIVEIKNKNKNGFFGFKEFLSSVKLTSEGYCLVFSFLNGCIAKVEKSTRDIFNDTWLLDVTIRDVDDNSSMSIQEFKDAHWIDSFLLDSEVKEALKKLSELTSEEIPEKLTKYLYLIKKEGTVSEHSSADFTAKKILADIAGMTVNDTHNSITTRIIFGKADKED